MKSGKIIALGLLALLPIAMKAQEAQEIEKLNARIDSLSQETTTLDKIVRKLSKFKVSAYIQGQFQYGQEDATLKSVTRTNMKTKVSTVSASAADG